MLDTIFARASARGKAGVAVVRISGPKAHEALALMTKVPEPRRASLRRLVWKNIILDEALVLVFKAGASFTGEASVELHLHGGRAVIAAVLGALSQISGLRLAEAGEFTRRALENGCLDFTQVEGLADLIDAETESQRIQSLRILSGAIGQKVEGWRKDLIRAAALLEASIDFADEDVPVDVLPEVKSILDKLITSFQAETDGARRAEQIRDGFEVVIIGRPNAGKSTLLNALAGRKAAIISEIAGTTRDIIEVRMDLSGLAVTLLDTAGIRVTEDKVEALGVDLAKERAKSADMRLFLLEEPTQALEIDFRPGDLKVVSKVDERRPEEKDTSVLWVSGSTGEGIAGLLDAIVGELSRRTAGAGILTRERQRIALFNATLSLIDAKDECEKAFPVLEIAAEDLRASVRFLEILLGRVDVEMLLDEIFTSFCIGK